MIKFKRKGNQKNLRIPITGTFLTFVIQIKNLRIISKKTLRGFWEIYPDSKQQLTSWYRETNEATWANPNQIKLIYPRASFLANNRVVFNIKGNTYRLIVRVSYEYQMVWIRFVGTHAHYDKIDANKI